VINKRFCVEPAPLITSFDRRLHPSAIPEVLRQYGDWLLNAQLYSRQTRERLARPQEHDAFVVGRVRAWTGRPRFRQVAELLDAACRAVFVAGGLLEDVSPEFDRDGLRMAEKRATPRRFRDVVTETPRPASLGAGP
jgi:hypothetical protein